MRLEGKVVLVTGASQGIGRAAAEGCALYGADVAINYLNDQAGAEAAVSAIKAMERRAIAVRGDVSDAASAPAVGGRRWRRSARSTAPASRSAQQASGAAAWSLLESSGLSDHDVADAVRNAELAVAPDEGAPAIEGLRRRTLAPPGQDVAARRLCGA